MCAHIALVHLYGKGPEIDGEVWSCLKGSSRV
jgi:hypothetical protein